MPNRWRCSKIEEPSRTSRPGTKAKTTARGLRDGDVDGMNGSAVASSSSLVTLSYLQPGLQQPLAIGSSHLTSKLRRETTRRRFPSSSVALSPMEALIAKAAKGSVLGYELSREGEPHNCLNDAQATMKLVLAKLEHGIDDPIAVAGNTVPNSDLEKLGFHKIPVQVPCQELRSLIHVEYNIAIQADLRVRGECYSTFAVFKDAPEADAAFRGLGGQETKGRSPGELEQPRAARERPHDCGGIELESPTGDRVGIARRVSTAGT